VKDFEDILLLTPDPFPPLSALVRADFAAATRRGPARTKNTDHYLVIRLGRSQDTILTSLPSRSIGQRFDEQAYGMVVADGMAEETASRRAIAALLQLALRYGRWQLRVDDHVSPEIIERLTHFYRQIDSALISVNRESPTALQTTLTCLVSGGKDLFFAHVGHSRAYLYRDGDLIQLTRDHTHAAQRAEARWRLMDLTGAPTDLRHLLTDALGAGTVDPRIDIERIQLVDGDILLLCTNGLSDVVGDLAIAEILESGRPLDEKAAALVEAAGNRGASDDVTAVLGRYRIPS
jgi:PPM family protein phosphatase